jgi:hypothetical protein
MMTDNTSYNGGEVFRSDTIPLSTRFNIDSPSLKSSSFFGQSYGKGMPMFTHIHNTSNTLDPNYKTKNLIQKVRLENTRMIVEAKNDQISHTKPS